MGNGWVGPYNPMRSWEGVAFDIPMVKKKKGIAVRSAFE